MTGPQTHHPAPAIPRLAEGLELIGEYEGSGFKETPYLARRADGQVIQLSYLLYLVAEAVDGQRDFGEIAERVTEEFGRTVSADNIRYLVENKLRPLGVLAAADGSSPELARATPLFMLRYRVGLVPAGVVRAITTLFWPLFLPPVVVAVLIGIVAFDLWLFFIHGGFGAGMREAIYQPASFAVLGFVVSSIALALHECGHATACRYGGAKPGVLGVGIYIIWMVFYSDVTDTYRLGKAGRLRTDLGGVYFEIVLMLVVVGAYFVTGYEPLLPLLVLMQVGLLDEFMPVLRFDGYYVVSDLTGVPDLFGRIKPVLVSLIPGREPDRRVTELKPWVRVVVSAWVLTVVPVLIALLAALIFLAPRIISTGWDSFLVHSDKLSSAFGAGKMGEAMLQLFDIVFLLIPVAGVILILTVVIRRCGMVAWRVSVGKPLLRAGFMAVPVVAGGLALAVWGPDLGQEEQVRQAGNAGVQGDAAPEAPADLTESKERGQDGYSAEPNGGSPPVPASGSKECAGDQDRCVEELVAQVSPQAEYAGGRIDANVSGSGLNREVLYFVDPTMEPCQYERLEYSTNDATIHTAIIAGEGSFELGNGARCVPEF